MKRITLPDSFGWSSCGVLLRQFTLICLLAAGGISLRAADGSLHYLIGHEPDALATLPPPPAVDSPEQAADMATVVAVHGTCTPREAAVAFSEKKFDVFTFAPAVGAFFIPAEALRYE